MKVSKLYRLICGIIRRDAVKFRMESVGMRIMVLSELHNRSLDQRFYDNRYLVRMGIYSRAHRRLARLLQCKKPFAKD